MILSACAALLFSFVDGIGKSLLSSSYGQSQVLMLSNFVAFTIFSVLLIKKRGLKTNPYQTKHLKWHIARGLSTCCMLVFIYIALPRIPLSDFYGLFFVGPIYASLLGIFLLKERPTIYKIASVILGFAGIIIIAGPQFQTFNIGLLAAIIAPIFFALSTVTLRIIGHNEEALIFPVFVTFIVATLNAPFALVNFSMPTLTDTAWFVLQGVFAAFAVLCFSLAYARAVTIAQVSPFQYTQLVWGTLIGWLVFNELPQANFLLGASLVMVAGLIVVYGQYRVGKSVPLRRL